MSLRNTVYAGTLVLGLLSMHHELHEKMKEHHHKGKVYHTDHAPEREEEDAHKRQKDRRKYKRSKK